MYGNKIHNLLVSLDPLNELSYDASTYCLIYNPTNFNKIYKKISFFEIIKKITFGHSVHLNGLQINKLINKYDLKKCNLFD